MGTGAEPLVNGGCYGWVSLHGSKTWQIYLCNREKLYFSHWGTHVLQNPYHRGLGQNILEDLGWVASLFKPNPMFKHCLYKAE